MHVRNPTSPQLLTRTLLALSLTLAPGCLISRTTVDQPLDSAALTALEPGTSTAADVVAALGAPDEVVQLGRRSAYRFDYSAYVRGLAPGSNLVLRPGDTIIVPD